MRSMPKVKAWCLRILHEVNRALATGQVDLHARVKARVHQTVIDENGKREQQTIVVDTTPGRCLLWEVVPEGLGFRAN